MKMIHKGQSGLTLIELLIVIAILGIIAAVIIPNIAGFIASGNKAAANTELENVKTASLGYYAAMNAWPQSSDDLTATQYVSGVLKARYEFDTTYGWVVNASLEVPNPWTNIVWVAGSAGANGTHGYWDTIRS